MSEARNLFRYVTAEEWSDYRCILSVFANTFFAELSPEDVVNRLRADDVPVAFDAVPDRLESLRRWGNLTVSSSVGNPSSLTDYYRRRNRYLITSAGQEVHDLVEAVMVRSDQVPDVATSRLGAIREALAQLAALVGDAPRFAAATPAQLTELVRAVFDPHQVFATEITQFFAAINQWQSRYDLTADELRVFAEVLVGYVSDRLDEIERAARPIAAHLVAIGPHVDAIVARLSGGLARRVEQAGLADTVTVRRSAGDHPQDWANLAAWFVRPARGPARIEQLRRDAVAAIRTLTQNLTRLSRSGIGATSRRADFLRLAIHLGSVDDADVHRLVAAAFGLYPCRHLGTLSADHGDPVATTTPWADAPPATVALSLRERGDTTNRGQPSPLRDRRTEREWIRRKRAEEFAAQELADAELLAIGRFDASCVQMLSMPAFRRLQSLLGSSRFEERAGTVLRCRIEARPAEVTVVACPEGRLALHGRAVEVSARG